MKVLCYGEILWDVFNDDKKIGGAPLNVAGHLRKLGADVYVVSAVGNDELGVITRVYLDKLDIDSRYVHSVEAETGKALIKLTDGIPSYRFTDPSAWDQISLTDEEKDELNHTEFDVIVFGTLAFRSKTSYMTGMWILQNVKARKRFFDVNIRLDFYTRELVTKALEYADILKLNDEELPMISDMLGYNFKSSISSLIGDFNLDMVLLTSGKKGSDVFTSDRSYHQDIRKVPIVDTVGAGDSLSAGFLYFLLERELSIPEVLYKASLLADYVVQKQGAIPDYDEELKRNLI